MELLKQAGEATNFQGVSRIYAPEFGHFDILVVELEFADWDQYHSYWEGAILGEEFWGKWFSITENGGTNEIWYLLE